MRFIASACFCFAALGATATSTDTVARLSASVSYTYGFPLGKFIKGNGNPFIQPGAHWGIAVAMAYRASRHLQLGLEIYGTAYKVNMQQIGKYYSAYEKSGFITRAENGDPALGKYYLELDVYSAIASYVYTTGHFQLKPFIQLGLGHLYPSSYDIYRKKYGDNYSERISSGWTWKPFFYPGIGISAAVPLLPWLGASAGARYSRGVYRYTFTETTTDFLNNQSVASYTGSLPVSALQLQAGLQFALGMKRPFKKKAG